jgi:hypothetical protein
VGALYIALSSTSREAGPVQASSMMGPGQVRYVEPSMIVCSFAPARPKAHDFTATRAGLGLIPSSPPTPSRPQVSRPCPSTPLPGAPRETAWRQEPHLPRVLARPDFFCPAGPMRTTTRGAVLGDGNVTERSYGPDFRSLGMINGLASRARVGVVGPVVAGKPRATWWGGDLVPLSSSPGKVEAMGVGWRGE